MKTNLRKTDLWTGPDPLLLASTSTTRHGLLAGAGIATETEAPGVDERAVEAVAARKHLAPEALARLLAQEKALAVSRRRPGRLVLGADQVLSCEGRVFHKPDGRDAARDQLLSLAGRRHTLSSAGALVRDGTVAEVFLAEAVLVMRPLTSEAVTHYLDLAGPGALASVGAYQVEGMGIHLFDRIEGDHSTILGLPLLPLLAALRRLGVLSL